MTSLQRLVWRQYIRKLSDVLKAPASPEVEPDSDKVTNLQ